MIQSQHEPENAASKPQLRQLALQFAAAFVVLSLAWPYFGLRNEPLPWPETAAAIGACALLLSTLTRQVWWWRLIHALFAPLVWAASHLAIDPGWYLLTFLTLLLFFRSAPGGQIPLYFSNTPTSEALVEIIKTIPAIHFIDLGAGIGSVLRPLAKMRPDAMFTGIENSPAVWLVGYLNIARLTNCTWQWGNFWQISLTKYNVVYAFLSPAPMTALWIKAQREMRPGGFFVSNSFAIPDVSPSQIIEVDDDRRTQLFCYQI